MICFLCKPQGPKLYFTLKINILGGEAVNSPNQSPTITNLVNRVRIRREETIAISWKQFSVAEHRGEIENVTPVDCSESARGGFRMQVGVTE